MENFSFYSDFLTDVILRTYYTTNEIHVDCIDAKDSKGNRLYSLTNGRFFITLNIQRIKFIYDTFHKYCGENSFSTKYWNKVCSALGYPNN